MALRALAIVGGALVVAAVAVFASRRETPEAAHEWRAAAAAASSSSSGGPRSPEGEDDDGRGEDGAEASGADARPAGPACIRRRRRRSSHSGSEQAGEAELTNEEKASLLRDMYPAVALDVCKFIVENFGGDLNESVRYLIQEYGSNLSQEHKECPGQEPSVRGRLPEMVMKRPDFSSDQVSGHSAGQPNLGFAEESREPLNRSEISEEERRELLALREKRTADSADSDDNQDPRRRARTEEELLSELSYLNALEQEIERKKVSLAEEERALNALAARVATLGSELGAESSGSPPQEGASLGGKADEERAATAANATSLQMSSDSAVHDRASILTGVEVAPGTGGEPAFGNSDAPDCISPSGFGFALVDVTEGGNAVASLPDSPDDYRGDELLGSLPPADPGDEFSERQEIAAASSELSWSDLGNDAQCAK